MDSTAYRVTLDSYSGPLDLLLYLVRRNEVDICDLPIAPITGQFNEYLTVLQFIDLDLVGDFIVMASTLIEIKSRMVLPRPEETPTESTASAEDPRSELIHQLLQYKRFKDAAQALEERAHAWQERYPRLSNDRPDFNNDPALDLIKEVELWDLVSALGRVIRHQHVEQHRRIRYDDTPISVWVERLKTRVRAEGRISFSSCFQDAPERSRIVGIFLAILELLRHHGHRAEQEHDFAEIWLMPPVDTSHVDSVSPPTQPQLPDASPAKQPPQASSAEQRPPEADTSPAVDDLPQDS